MLHEDSRPSRYPWRPSKKRMADARTKGRYFLPFHMQTVLHAFVCPKMPVDGEVGSRNAWSAVEERRGLMQCQTLRCWLVNPKQTQDRIYMMLPRSNWEGLLKCREQKLYPSQASTAVGVSAVEGLQEPYITVINFI